MKILSRVLLLSLVLGSGGILLALPQSQQLRNYRSDRSEFGSNEHSDEFAFTRLRYPTRGGYNGYGAYGRFGGFGFRPNLGWSEDYPAADRKFVQGVVRLTRLDARPYQEVADPDDDDMFDYPWMYAVNVANWDFTDAQAKRMRDYLQRGGFLVVDSFHGAAEWETFLSGMRKILPDRPVEELDNKDEIFHVLYDLDQKVQIPGYQYVSTGRTYELDGFDPHWRAIRDEQGRILVLIGFNMHIGDAWEHADDPWYPERFSSLAYRLGINYIIYGMTH
jgi:hypothetical protein